MRDVRDGHRWAGDWWAGQWWTAFGVVVGLALVASGVRPGLGAWAARPAHSVVADLGRGLEPDRTDLLAGVGALEGSLQWPGMHAPAYGSLALLQLERARRAAGEPGISLPLIDAGVAAQRAALALAPARGSGWARLVYADTLLAGELHAQAIWALSPEAEALEARAASARARALLALEMAFLTRDLGFSLVRFRLAAALERWPALRPWLRTAARAEVLELTRYGAQGMDALVDLYLATPGHFVIDEELAADPKQRGIFEKRLARRVRSG